MSIQCMRERVHEMSSVGFFVQCLFIAIIILTYFFGKEWLIEVLVIAVIFCVLDARFLDFYQLLNNAEGNENIREIYTRIEALEKTIKNTKNE